MGATTSMFPYDAQMADYLRVTSRNEVADLAETVKADLCADAEVYENPEAYYDQCITIDLDKLQPYVNGPFTPDAACQVSDMAAKVERDNLPPKVEVCLIGSCTNSSYQDMDRAASVVKALRAAGHELKAQLIVNPGSELIRATAEKNGSLKTVKDAGAIIMTNACVACIGL